MLIAHISDSHLGAMPYNKSERENDFYESFNEAIDTIISMGAEIVIHSGDIFDVPKPSGTAMVKLVDSLKRLREKNIRFLFTMGEHDISRLYAIPSPFLYQRVDLATYIGNGEPFEVSDELMVVGFHKRRKDEVEELKAKLSTLDERTKDARGRKILVLHQALYEFNKYAGELSVSDLPKSFDYYAMGHLHDKGENCFNELKGKVCYPGSLDVTGNDGIKEFHKGFYLVDLLPDEVKTEWIELKSTRRHFSFEVDYGKMDDAVQEIIAKIKDLAKKPMVNVVVKGSDMDAAKISSSLRPLENYTLYHQWDVEETGTSKVKDYMEKPADIEQEMLIRAESITGSKEAASLAINHNEGVSVFVGHNGAGKSSVIDAVTFALYGEHMRGDNRNLVRRGASESAVSVTFSVRGKKYLAQRRVDAKGKLQAAVLKEITEHGVRQIVAGERRQMEESMAEEVRKITGLSFDMMKIATIVQQGELDKIVTEYKPSEVKNLINEVIGIEKLDKAYQSMREVLNDFKRRLREAYYNYDTDSIDALVQQVGKDKKEREEETSALQAILSELQKLQEEEKAVTERIRTLEELKAKADKANTLRQNLNNRVEELRDDLKREIKELEAKIPKARSSLLLVKEKEEVESALAKLVQREQELGTIIGELMGKMGELKGIDVKRMESEIQKLEGKLKEKSTRIDELLSKIKQLEGVKKPGERSELEAKQSELEEARDEARGKLGQIREKINDYERIKQTGVCPVCDTEVTPENVEAKLAVKKKEEEEKSNEIKNIENELKNVNNYLKT